MIINDEGYLGRIELAIKEVSDGNMVEFIPIRGKFTSGSVASYISDIFEVDPTAVSYLMTTEDYSAEELGIVKAYYESIDFTATITDNKAILIEYPGKDRTGTGTRDLIELLKLLSAENPESKSIKLDFINKAGYAALSWKVLARTAAITRSKIMSTDDDRTLIIELG